MELIERYLQAVKFWLPSKQSNDIIAELSADLHAQVEERQGEMGRDLTHAEIETLLKQRGQPLLVANRFLPQRSLIGPVLYPVYTFVMKAAFACYFIPWLVITIGLAAYNPSGAVRPSWVTGLAAVPGNMLHAAFFAFAAITVIFAVLERTQAKLRLFDQWEPRTLPPLRNANAIPRSSSIIEMAVNWIFFLWWAADFHSTELSFGSSVHIFLSSTWLWVYWATFILALANATLAAANLFRPYWTPLRATLRALAEAAGAVLLCMMLKSHVLLGITVNSIPAEKSRAITETIYRWMPAAFLIALVVAFIVIAVAAARVLRVSRTQNSSADSSV